MVAKSKKKPDVMNEAERAYAIIDKYVRNENDRVQIKQSLTPAIIQFLLRWEFDRDVGIEEKVIEIVMKKMQEIYIADNEALCGKVADIVSKQLSEVLEFWNTRLGGIEKALEGVADWQKSVDDLIKKMDERIEHLEDKEKSVDKQIDKLVKFVGWKNMLLRKAIVIAIAVGISLFIFFRILNNRLDTLENMIREHVKTEIRK